MEVQCFSFFDDTQALASAALLDHNVIVGVCARGEPGLVDMVGLIREDTNVQYNVILLLVSVMSSAVHTLRSECKIHDRSRR